MTKPRRFDEGLALRMLGVRDEVHPCDAFAHVHRTRESAQRYVDVNAEKYDHPSFGPLETDGGWIEVVNFRPAIEAYGSPPTDPVLPDDWTPRQAKEAI